MRNRAGSIPLTDWVAITIRWLLLIGVSLWLAIGEGLQPPVLFVLVLAVMGNILAAVLVVLNLNTFAFRIICILGDLLVAYLLYFLTGSIYGPLTWIGLLPLASAALYLQWIGAILLTLLNILVQGIMGASIAPIQDLFTLILVLLPLYLVVGLGLAFVSQRLNKGICMIPKPRIGKQTDAERLEQERRRAIFILISSLNASLNYQKVLESSLDLSANTLSQLDAPADKLVSAVLLFTVSEQETPELHVAASRRFVPSDTRVTLPGTRGLLGQAIDEGEPRLSKSLSSDAELSRFVALHACRSAYCVPLRRNLDAYGILLFAHPESEFFSSERREILDMVGNQSMIAIQNATLYKDLSQEKERMMEIQEEARKKMARDLHDGPTQSVSAIAMRVNFARRLLDRDTKAASEELFKIEELARRTTKEIRHMLFTLRPLVLESQGLVAALNSMADKMKETYSQNVIIQADQRAVEALEAGKQAVVFYIAEEAANNARKHAQATHIWVRLKMLRENISMLEIEDDGVGFNVGDIGASYESRGSLGMVNMRERSELVNGALRVDSSIGRGTRVQVVIPLNEDAAELMRRNM